MSALAQAETEPQTEEVGSADETQEADEHIQVRDVHVNSRPRPEFSKLALRMT